MMLDEFGNEVDAGYPIRMFDHDLEYCDWIKDIGDFKYDYRYTNVEKKLSNQKGVKEFGNFLKILNSAPDLTTQPPEADEDTKALCERPWFDVALDDIIYLSHIKDTEKVPMQTDAIKTLQQLSNKGYPKAQSAYAHYLSVVKGNHNLANAVLTQLETNPLASEGEQDLASFDKLKVKSNKEKKCLADVLFEQSQKGAKKQTFMDKATKAEDLQDIAEENLEAKINQVNHEVLAHFADRPYSEWKKEEIQALETFSNKGYPRAQEFLMWYYEEKGQYSKAYGTADKLRRNPFADEAFRDSGTEHVKKMAPLARKEQALKQGGRK